MNILVCISNVPDTTSKIEFLNDSTKFNNELSKREKNIFS